MGFGHLRYWGDGVINGFAQYSVDTDPPCLWLKSGSLCFRSSAVNELGYHDAVNDHVVEPMHNLLLGKIALELCIHSP